MTNARSSQKARKPRAAGRKACTKSATYSITKGSDPNKIRHNNEFFRTSKFYRKPNLAAMALECPRTRLTVKTARQQKVPRLVCVSDEAHKIRSTAQVQWKRGKMATVLMTYKGPSFYAVYADYTCTYPKVENEICEILKKMSASGVLYVTISRRETGHTTALLEARASSISDLIMRSKRCSVVSREVETYCGSPNGGSPMGLMKFTWGSGERLAPP